MYTGKTKHFLPRPSVKHFMFDKHNMKNLVKSMLFFQTSNHFS